MNDLVVLTLALLSGILGFSHPMRTVRSLDFPSFQIPALVVLNIPQFSIARLGQETKG